MLNHHSIKQRLLVSVLGSFVLIWFIIAILAYNSSSHESEEIYDAALASYARIIASLMAHEAEEEQELEENFDLLLKELGDDILLKSSVLSGVKKKLARGQSNDYMSLALTDKIKGHSYESQIVFIVMKPTGQVLLRSRNMPPQTEFHNGFFNIDVQGKSWRVFGLELQQPGLQILVSENLEVRTELQHLIIVNLLWPFILLFPILGIIIWLAIKNGLLPLAKITENISNRNPNSLLAIKTTNVPDEVSPLINELNSLFKRIENTLENEKRFTANAAHELRTPLAAMKTHAQVIELNASEKIKSNVKQMVSSIDRSSHLVDQLLTLSKAEANLNKGMSLKPVDLISVIRTQLSEFSSTAIDNDINLSFKSNLKSCLIKGDETLLHIVMRNIIDNAIRYSKNGGQLEVIVEKMANNIKVSIKDDGPGIEENKLELMTQRFQRGSNSHKQGSGLGLFIVRQVMSIMNGSLSFSSKPPKGLVVTLGFRLYEINESKL
ncbi:MAG: hypothetical protein GY694_06090 [Gammaproteobacteria bacterium]|nr:hypothetical protein [Gammaproteobacteria bacterium]